MPMTYLPTGFETLDKLLGGNGLLMQKTVLVRGHAGTGKTTLALQIAMNAMKYHEHWVVFVAVEEDPEESLSAIYRSLDLGNLGYGADWDAFKKLHSRFGMQPLDETLFYDPNVNSIGDLLDRFWELIPTAAVSPVLVVIDSLNALVYWAQTRFPNTQERQILLSVLQSFKNWLRGHGPRPTVIFTAEDASGFPTFTAESYLSDTVIQLRAEKSTKPLQSMQAQLRDSYIYGEDLLFCLVKKGRGLHTQRRSSCYEFVEGAGIKFFPTYAALGVVSLFCENEPQADSIKSLWTVDIPSSYPGVIVQSFTRSGLQRMFAVERSTERIPPREPLHLSNIDEYWIAVLTEANLLYPIPQEELKLFSLPIVDPGPKPGEPAVGPPPAGAQPQGTTCVIWELRTEEKRRGYREGNNYLAVPHMGNVGMLVYRKDLIDGGEPPNTWEDLATICIEYRNQRNAYPLLIETQTYDTLLSTALELGWAHGAFWHTEKREGGPEERLRIVFDQGSSFADFVDAIKSLHRWIHDDQIIPPASSVDPGSYRNTDWVFARHWYSTWTDYLTARGREGEPLITFPGDAILGVAPIPVFAAYAAGQGGQPPFRHHSAWGEWYLAIHRNSENVELGIDLINNLSTSRKLIDLATQGAALPVIEKVYEMYGETLCFGTDKTLNEIRGLFFKDARSRTAFRDFRRVGRILYGTLLAVVSNPRADVEGLLVRAFTEIDNEFAP